MATAENLQSRPDGANRRVAIACAALVAGMTGAAFAAVPFYEWFCKTTGYGGTPLTASSAPDHVIERSFEIRFDANVNGLPWRFTPETPSVTVKAGAVETVNYVIENTSDRETFGLAAYNVTPDLSGGYFTKMICFCFTEQKLAAGEKLVVPVTFYVDPQIDGDKDLTMLKTITLSYTFFPAKPNTSKPVVGSLSGSTPEKL
ncbi:cytochrome c oxidase assembly protein [Prosthecomicrobium hirschii]|uniref:cytochrome c oxidase assembly protein n=1 Tax=Prosthecodimorpha hirschii TaxID=665126 RepID=UPI001126FF75|nr:cytochrome c oxidase assembly protein [Prosthecomicrobium hirschii]MCW1840941.1 cytochrome c oxidase assembly protein [Prosthecomicrobium hirschii]TPQ52743.1 cytochrome c oxidase assembly protein [Prosthecomicrobium hirschii]